MCHGTQLMIIDRLKRQLLRIHIEYNKQDHSSLNEEEQNRPENLTTLSHLRILYH